MTDCTSYKNATRAVTLYYACLIGRGSNQRLHSLRQDMEDLHCNRLSSNICRMMMYRLPVREYCVLKMHV